MLSFLLALAGIAADVAVAAAPHPAAKVEIRCTAGCLEQDAAAGAIVATTPRGLLAPEGVASRVERSLARLNALRTASGTHALGRSELLSLSASRHAAYLSENGFRSAPSVHAETAGLASFSGVDPFVRMRTVGYHSPYATEVVGDIGSVAADTDCVDHLMSTVYHAALLLGRVTEAGMAYGVGGAAGACVIDLGVALSASPSELDAVGRIVRYPWDGMTTPAGSLHLDSEIPRPPPALLPDANVGIPVLVGLRNAAPVIAGSGAWQVQIQDFELRDAGDMPVSSVVLADSAISGPGIVADAALHGGFAVLVPRKPLAPGRYRVLLHATIGASVIAPGPWAFDVAPRVTSSGESPLAGPPGSAVARH